MSKPASMRPRLITAENAGGGAETPRPPARFNEAAAHHRGEHDSATNSLRRFAALQ